MVFNSRFGLCAVALALGWVAATPAAAQDYPSKPVTVVVSLAAGTGMDTLTRLYSEKLQESLGKPFVIENRPGASMMLAATSVATAPADGHTLLVSSSAAFAINPSLYAKINYDPNKDFTPVALYVKSPFILVVNPELSVKTVPELIKLAKERATPLSYSSPGAGLAQHLSTEYMKQRFGLNFTHVPYRSSPQAISDIVAGHVQFGFAEAGASLPLIREGKLRALAVSSLTRLPSLPDVPPFAEAASAPGFEAVSWHMLYAPSGTPQPVVERLHLEVKRVMALPEIKEKISAIGLLPLDPPALPETLAYQKAEQEKWGSLVKSLGLAASQ